MRQAGLVYPSAKHFERCPRKQGQYQQSNQVTGSIVVEIKVDLHLSPALAWHMAVSELPMPAGHSAQLWPLTIQAYRPSGNQRLVPANTALLYWRVSQRLIKSA